MVKLSTSVHSMPGFSLNCNENTAKIIRGIISNSYTDSMDYQMKIPCQPFLQCFDLCGDNSYVLVEFWGKKGHQEFVDYVNSQLSDFYRE